MQTHALAVSFVLHSTCQCLPDATMAFSFFNIAWALVDYRRCLRRSLPSVRRMPSGIPTAVYLLYKLCTVTSLILSYTLLLILSSYTTAALAVLWLLGTTWAHVLRTGFCSSRGLELLYRAVVGVILTFTFFNVKGQDTRVAMIIYYSLYSCVNSAALLTLAFLKPELLTATSLLLVSTLISGCLVLGLVCLILYYLLLHPRDTWREADEVDGLEKEAATVRRIKTFLQD